MYSMLVPALVSLFWSTSIAYVSYKGTTATKFNHERFYNRCIWGFYVLATAITLIAGVIRFKMETNARETITLLAYFFLIIMPIVLCLVFSIYCIVRVKKHL